MIISTFHHRLLAWGAAAGILFALSPCPYLRAADTLPDYHPRGEVVGIIRSRGSDKMARLMQLWEEGFQKFHPQARFADRLKGSASGMYGLEMRTADIAVMGRPINPFERYGTYERSWVYPVEIQVATGSESAPSKSPAYAIFVHKDNPLAKLTLQQLDGIFGAQRLGGWNALSWEESAARTAKDNLRTWGQVGLKGPWADRQIHVYGPPILGAGVITYFETRVMSGGVLWNEDLREYADRKQLIAALAADPDGIGYCSLSYATDQVKPLAIAEKRGGPYVPLTRATVADRTYPLARPVFVDYTIDNERAEYTHPRGDPKVKEFLRYILSRQGQADVVREGTYLPLPADVVAAQLAKMDSTAVPPERKLLTN